MYAIRSYYALALDDAAGYLVLGTQFGELLTSDFRVRAAFFVGVVVASYNFV